MLKKYQILNIFRLVAVVMVGFCLNFGILGKAYATTTYFCSDGGGGDCAVLYSGSYVVEHANITVASPAKHETWEGILCGDNHVSYANNCPFNNTQLNFDYNGDNIDGIKFTNYNNQCMAWSQGNDNY